MKRDKQLFKVTYKARAMRIRPGKLPTLHHTLGFVVDSAEIRTTGKIERNGERLEFQDIRVYLRERNDPEIACPEDE